MNWPELARIVLLAAVLAGCAERGEVVLQTEPEPQAGIAPPAWPRGPELSRFIYAGELTGEDNFVEVGAKDPGFAQQALAFVLGLGIDKPEALVLQRPQGGATDEAGRVFVTDVSRQAVFVFDERAGRLQVWVDADAETRFVAPIGIALAERGGLLVTDAELGAVYRLDARGRPLGAFGAGVLERPTGIARDPVSGRIYVSDTHAHDIKAFDRDGNLLARIGRRGTGPGELNAPTYIAFSEGRLYVTDTLNSRVQIFAVDGQVLSTFGARGLYVGNFSRPKGIAIGSEGNIYVVESYYDHLLVFDRDGRLLLPIGGTGNEPGQFYLPAGVWTDSRNRVYVADMFNGRVSIFQFLGGA